MIRGLRVTVRVSGWLYIAVSVAILPIFILQSGWRLGESGIVPDWGHLSQLPLLLLVWPLALPLMLVMRGHWEPISNSLPVMIGLLCVGLSVAVAWTATGWYVLISTCRRRFGRTRRV